MNIINTIDKYMWIIVVLVILIIGVEIIHMENKEIQNCIEKFGKDNKNCILLEN